MSDEEALDINELQLLPNIRWDKPLEPHWRIGETGAHETLVQFIQSGLLDYDKGRDFPAKAHTSRLSPHLRFGEISPHQVWHAVRQRDDNDHVDRFCSELGWREFSCSLLFHHPTLPRDNLQKKFDVPRQHKVDHLVNLLKRHFSFIITSIGVNNE